MSAPSIRLAVLAILLAGTPVRADTLAYIRASSQAERDADIAKYHPMNLLDDDPATLWCEGDPGDGEGQGIRIIFKKAQKIDRVVIGPTLKTGRRVLTVEVSDGINVIRIQLGDRYAEQSFSPAMKGEEYTVTILEVGPANEAAKDLGPNVACLADVMMYLKKKPFGGRTPPSKLRFDKNRDRILGVWNGGDLGAPEKYLTFGLDGTWAWKYEPLMGGKPKKLKGEYRFRGGRLLMRKGETGRWGDVRFKYEHVKIDPNAPGAPLGDYSKLSFNDLLCKEFAGAYNDAQF